MLEGVWNRASKENGFRMCSEASYGIERDFLRALSRPLRAFHLEVFYGINRGALRVHSGPLRVPSLEVFYGIDRGSLRVHTRPLVALFRDLPHRIEGFLDLFLTME